MPKPIDILDECAQEIAIAFNQYRIISEPLGFRFLDAIERNLGMIIANPEIGAPAHRGSRRMVLTHFPYVLYYLGLNDSTKIIGFVHAKQNPRLTQKMLKERS